MLKVKKTKKKRKLEKILILVSEFIATQN
jgi:hypothetical protein